MDFERRSDAPFPLLSLPAELRAKLYTTILGGNVIHVGGTGHQPYAEGMLSYGRCCSCTAPISDVDCYKRYTLQSKPLAGELPPDRFSRRHRDCHRLPVSHRLKLNLLRVCKQIYQEAAPLVFEENIFALSRPSSLRPFLERLNDTQVKSIRTIMVYSTESGATWIGPLQDQDLAGRLTGLLRLRVYLELKHFEPREQLENAATQDRRLSGLTMFKAPSLSHVQLWILTPDWTDIWAENLDETTVEGMEGWESRLKQKLLAIQ